MANELETPSDSDSTWQPGAATFGGIRDNASGELPLAPGPNHEERLAAVQAARDAGRNPLLEAARPLLRCLAEMPVELQPQGVAALGRLLDQEVQAYTRLCEQANLRRDHMLAVRYALCTALDEAASLRHWGGGVGETTGVWSTQALLNKFHGESRGGKTLFLVIGRLAQDVQEHRDVLEVIHHILSLGFMGDYRVQADGARMLESIRHKIYTLVMNGREPVARELSVHWRGADAGRFRLLRSIPVWVSATTLGLVLLAMFGWYKYQLLTTSTQVEAGIQALLKLAPETRPSNFADRLAEEIRAGQLSVKEDASHALVMFKGDGMFAGGLVNLSKPALAMLDKVAKALNEFPGQVRVIGHTDNTAIHTARYASNKALSEARARAVALALSQRGVAEARIQTGGMGDAQPLEPNATAAGRAANRRVEIEILFGVAGAPAASGAAAESSSGAAPPKPGPVARPKPPSAVHAPTEQRVSAGDAPQGRRQEADAALKLPPAPSATPAAAPTPTPAPAAATTPSAPPPDAAGAATKN